MSADGDSTFAVAADTVFQLRPYHFQSRYCLQHKVVSVLRLDVEFNFDFERKRSPTRGLVINEPELELHHSTVADFGAFTVNRMLLCSYDCFCNLPAGAQIMEMSSECWQL